MRRPLVYLVVAIAVLAAGALWLQQRSASGPAMPAAPRLPELDGVAGWVNGGPLTSDSLRGHPVALVVWSDTDPRGLALLSEAVAWDRAYARYGVRVVGLHAPDFAFAADPSVTASAARRLGASFPIALDPAHRVRAALGLRETQGIVLADGAGAIVLSTGVAGMGPADAALREMVRAAHPGAAFPAHAGGEASAGAPILPDGMRFVHTGTARVPGGPLAGTAPGRAQTFTTQFRYQEEGEPLVPYPVGRWTPSGEGITAARGGAANFIALRTEGGSIGAVLGPPPAGVSRVWVLEGDDWLAPDARGADVRADARGATFVEVSEPRLYAIAHGRARLLKLSPDAPGVTIYGFAIEAE